MMQPNSFSVLLFFLLVTACQSLSIDSKTKVAVIGATGNVGRQVVQTLAAQNVPIKCLLRKPIPSSTVPSINNDADSTQVAAYLSNLPSVEMVEGDVTQKESLSKLMEDCTVVFALHGPKSYPFYKTLLPLLFLPESDPTHSKMINYVGIKNIIDVANEQDSIKKIVRITGKGEDPFSIFSILINMFGTMAKGWNYEGEQLLRKSNLDYTIIRPGIMGTPNVATGKVLGLKDNGINMKVTPVSHSQIADLCLKSVEYDNCARSTLTAMNVEEGDGEEEYGPLLKNVKSDSREFPETLIAEHKKGARIGSGVLFLFTALIVKLFTTLF